jgi:solute carrier family 25, member 39/40
MTTSSSSLEQQPHTTTKVATDPLWVRIVSGSVGSTLTAVLVTPLEVVKVRQQFQSPSTTAYSQNITISSTVTPKRVGQCSSCGVFVFNNGLKECILPRSIVPYFDPITGRLKENATVSKSKGTFTMLRSIFRTEGMAGIYAGLTPTLVMGIPNTVLYFASYEEFRERIKRSEMVSAGFGPALAGAAARAVASFATAPLELIRTRQAAQIGGGQMAGGLIAELKNVVSVEGAFSLYKGLGPTLMRDVPFSAVYWYFVEKMRLSWGDESNFAPTEQAWHALVNGSTAGMLAAAITTPLDVVKTRLQVMPYAEVEAILQTSTAAVCDPPCAILYDVKPAAQKANPSSTTLAMIRHIVSEDGISGLWRGNQARMIKVAPACAIMLSTYEIGKRLLSEST